MSYSSYNLEVLKRDLASVISLLLHVKICVEVLFGRDHKSHELRELKIGEKEFAHCQSFDSSNTHSLDVHSSNVHSLGVFDPWSLRSSGFDEHRFVMLNIC